MSEIHYHLELVSGPVKEPVTFEEAINNLRLNEMERVVESLITAARQHIDGKNGWLGRALITQTWDLVLDAFPCDYILIPLPPLQEIVSITYTDENGDTQTLAEANYVIQQSEPAKVRPAYNITFPATRKIHGAVRVRFRAGYGDNPDDVPRPIKQALLLLIGHLYENRDQFTSGTIADLPMVTDALLMPYRMSWL